jgi:hypothetical protein
MPIPLHFRLSSFSSPADTPRPQFLPQPLKITSDDHAPKSQGINSKTQFPAELQQVHAQTGQFNDGNEHASEKRFMHHRTMHNAIVFSSPRQSQRQPRNLDATLIPSRQLTPVEASSSASLKSESPLVESPKSTAATEAAEKAARMTRQMKANISAQARLSQFQAVQAAAVQKPVADTEHKNSTKVLESAYMNKVEEAAVLRRECLKLQEMIGTLQLNINIPAGNSQTEICELSEQTEAASIDFQVNPSPFIFRVHTESTDVLFGCILFINLLIYPDTQHQQSKGIDKEIVHLSRKQLLVSSLQNFSLSPDQEQPFEA